ncbi:hypothetical protein SporoP33_11770 [Sporosarcina sp. P33]|nr:hypothetical protein SporoP33_11770 [Sporosarcina sp. P33]
MLMPNIPTKTLGGEFWWKTIDKHCGWKLQKNIVTNHYRILDENKVRQAWSLKKKSILSVFYTITGKVPFQKK